MTDARDLPASEPVAGTAVSTTSRTNTYVVGSLVSGVIALLLGTVVLLIGISTSPKPTRVLESTAELAWGSVLVLLGLGLVIGSVVIAGVGWALRNRQP